MIAPKKTQRKRNSRRATIQLKKVKKGGKVYTYRVQRWWEEGVYRSKSLGAMVKESGHV